MQSNQFVNKMTARQAQQTAGVAPGIKRVHGREGAESGIWIRGCGERWGENLMAEEWIKGAIQSGGQTLVRVAHNPRQLCATNLRVTCTHVIEQQGAS